MTANFIAWSVAGRVRPRKKFLLHATQVVPPLPLPGERIKVSKYESCPPLSTGEQSLTSRIRCATGRTAVLSLYEAARRSCPLSLMRGSPLLSVIIVHDETRVNYSRNPAQQRQNDA